jgi:alkylation response protein AidB-like acyl-CoA dehydrogenase
MYDLHLSAEQLEMRDAVRDFIGHEVKPLALKASRLEAGDRRLPLSLVAKASRMGLRALTLDEAHGGAGVDRLTACLVAEELATGDAGLAAMLVQTAVLSGALFGRAMSEAQRNLWLPRFLGDDDCHLALAAREPGEDAGVGAHYHRPLPEAPPASTTATRADNGDWILNGTKAFVANAPVAKLFVVQARTASGTSSFLVPRDAQGMVVRETSGTDWYHGARGDVVLAGCRVPAAQLLGEEGRSAIAGQQDALGPLAPEVQAMNVGIGRVALEAAVDYAKLRVQGGRRIIEHQSIGSKLAEITVRLEMARALVWKAAWILEHPEAIADRSVADLPYAAMAKVAASEAVREVALVSAECFGAMGVMRDMPQQMYVRDAFIFLHGGYTNDEAKLQIGEAIAGYGRS